MMKKLLSVFLLLVTFKANAFTIVTYTYDNSNRSQPFIGTVSAGITFNHQGGLPILKIVTFNDVTDVATVAAGYEYTHNSVASTHYFEEPEPQINSTFTVDTTTFNIDSVDSVNYTITVSEVP